MRDAHDPSLLAASVWEQAAARVRALHRDDDAEVAAPWNDALDHAAVVLEQEVGNVRAMGRMARMLIAGNTGRPE